MVIKMEKTEVSVEDLVRMLDGFAKSDESRLTLHMDDELEAGKRVKEYHHGRCDVNSPWACGAHIGAEIDDEYGR